MVSRITTNRPNFASLASPLLCIFNFIFRSLIFSNMADDSSKQAAASAQQNVTINAASIKLPEFIIKNPLWLIQAEAQFRIAHITSEKTKYYHNISRLPAAVLIDCKDVVVETYKKDDLDKLKQTLLDRYILSTDQRIKEVLDNIRFTHPELPSAFFRRLIATASGTLAYDIILQRLCERLPSNISNAIAPMTNNLGALFKNTSSAQQMSPQFDKDELK